jgi:hypothetical protein
MDQMTELMLKYQMQPRGMRTGQAYFNAAYALWPQVVDRICGTNLDPFYDDANLPKFFAYLLENVDA